MYAANKRWYDYLLDDAQTIFRTAYMTPETAFPILSRQTNDLLTSISRQDVQVHDLTREQRTQWQRATARAVDQIIAQAGGWVAELYGLVLEGKREFALKVAVETEL